MVRIIFAFLFFSFGQLAASQSRIIYLNGTSSVGKSTLAKALQENLTTPYLLVGIDLIIEMMPPKINNWEGKPAELGFSWKRGQDEEGHPLQILQMGPFGAKMPMALQAVAKALADSGFNLIIDDVACDPNSQMSWKKALEGHKVIWVGLTAPIDVIEQREKARPDRQIGQARAIYKEVHNGFTYDLFFDTSQKSIPDMVQQILTAGK